MSVDEKISKLRKMYIMQYGEEPKSVIVGYEVLEEIKRLYSMRYIESGVEMLGMRIIVDMNKPTRVEVGNLRVAA